MKKQKKPRPQKGRDLRSRYHPRSASWAASHWQRTYTVTQPLATVWARHLSTGEFTCVPCNGGHPAALIRPSGSALHLGEDIQLRSGHRLSAMHRLSGDQRTSVYSFSSAMINELQFNYY